jgi:hypothetical protein
MSNDDDFDSDYDLTHVMLEVDNIKYAKSLSSQDIHNIKEVELPRLVKRISNLEIRIKNLEEKDKL